MKTAYLGIKFYEDNRNKKQIEEITDSLKRANIKVITVAKDYEEWGKIKLQASVALQVAFNYIKKSDMFIAEYSEEAVGVLLEAEYAYKNKIPIVIIAKEETKIPEELKRLAHEIFYYELPEQLTIKFNSIK